MVTVFQTCGVGGKLKWCKGISGLNIRRFININPINIRGALAVGIELFF